MMKQIRYLLLLFSCLATPGMAMTVSGLYQATVSVADESVNNRAQALRQAMQQVLVKLSGKSDIADDAGAAAIIENAQQFVQQFRYNQVRDEESGLATRLELQVRFDETTLVGEMRNYALPLWGKQRPAILVWLAYDAEDGRRLASLEEDPELVAALEEAAGTRGLPLVFPLMDLQDTSQLSVSDVWGSFRQPIMEASARYPSDAVLVGRIQQVQDGTWDTQWTLLMEQQAQDWSNQAGTAEQVLAMAVDELADTLASLYVATGSSGAELVELNVTGVGSFDDYARTLTYLESLQSVTDVKVKKVVAEDVSFEVVSHGGVEALNQAIQLGDVLQVNNPAVNSYRLRAGYR